MTASMPAAGHPGLLRSLRALAQGAVGPRGLAPPRRHVEGQIFGRLLTCVEMRRS